MKSLNHPSWQFAGVIISAIALVIALFPDHEEFRVPGLVLAAIVLAIPFLTNIVGDGKSPKARMHALLYFVFVYTFIILGVISFIINSREQRYEAYLKDCINEKSEDYRFIIQQCSLAISINNNEKEPFIRRAKAYFSSKSYNEGVEDYMTAIRLGENAGKVYGDIAFSYALSSAETDTEKMQNHKNANKYFIIAAYNTGNDKPSYVNYICQAADEITYYGTKDEQVKSLHECLDLAASIGDFKSLEVIQAQMALRRIEAK